MLRSKSLDAPTVDNKIAHKIRVPRSPHHKELPILFPHRVLTKETAYKLN
jgi:hypothetical protein